MAIIEVDTLCKIFRRGDEEISALDKVSLTINQGEFLALTGPSGSGKSTLLYILGLLDNPSSGTYRLEGVNTTTLSDSEMAKLRNQRIGFIFQSFHLLPRATALRNVMLPLIYSASYGVTISEQEIRSRAEETLRRVGLGDRLFHRSNELSGGQCQRVAIARALVNNPRIVFADEPTGNLDSKTGIEILGVLRALHEQGVTIVLVSHDLSIARSAKRLLTMIDGRIVEDISC